MNNLDLFFVGIVVVITCIFGFTVYFSNTKSVTNRVFLLYSINAAVWGIANYLAYQISDTDQIIWVIRSVVFLATFQALFLYQLFLVFPNENYTFSNRHKHILIPTSIFIAFLTLTPLVFSKAYYQGIGKVSTAEPGYLMLLFVSFTLCLTIKTFYTAIKRTWSTRSSLERKPLLIITIGFIISYSLIAILNLIFPSILHITDYVPLSSIFIFPFIVFTTYAILRHKLLQVRAIRVLLLIVLLLIVTLFDVLYSYTPRELMRNLVVIVFEIIVSVVLIKGAIHEEQQKSEIQKLVNKLRDLDEFKTKFVSHARHQIATPLTAVKGYISLLSDDVYGEVPERIRQPLDVIRELTDKFIHIVHDFLDITRINEGEVTYLIEDHNLSELIEVVQADYELIFNKQGITFNLKYEKNITYNIRIDQQKIYQAFANIIGNSIRFSKGGKVTVNLALKNADFEITITDNAVRSIPAVNEKLVKKLSSSNNSIEAAIIGNDLGLYVAKQYIEGHKGSFTVTQNRDNTTTFTILLPKNH